MHRLRFTVAVWTALTACLVYAAEEKAAVEKNKTDAERIVGSWTFDSSDKKFELIQSDEQTIRLKFEDGKMNFALLNKGAPAFQLSGSYALDDKQTPKLFDVTLTGDGAAPVFAIYEFQGDKLRIRYREEGGQRPSDFTTPAADCQILTFVREKEPK
ncbi:MAG: TIGR03067 domain-containing protein [Planctomycetia bacterium]|nr:TIGR03067 domain-containing protein [Planctomycetia bacterium]